MLATYMLRWKNTSKNKTYFQSCPRYEVSQITGYRSPELRSCIKYRMKPQIQPPIIQYRLIQ